MPEHSLPMYVEGQPAASQLRDAKLIELAVLEDINFITTSSHSKHTSLIFVRRKSSGKLLIIVDLPRVNHLLHQKNLISKFLI